jgi:DNA polymerase III subunit delta
MPAKSNDSRIWLVTGSEESDIKKAAATLASRLAPGDDPFSSEVVDAAVQTVDEACQALSNARAALLTVPLFGGDKLVWLKNVNFLTDNIVGRSETVTRGWENLLATLQEGLPEGMKFLISAPEADKRRTIYKTLVKLASVEIHDKPDFGWGATEADVIAWVAGKAKEQGLDIEEDAMETLAARVGADARQISMELEKLSLSVQPGEPVTLDVVRRLVPSTRQGGIFDLSNCILRRDLPGALSTMEQLLRQKETALGILLAAIVPTMRNLLIVADLMERHRLPPPAKAHFFAKTLERLRDSETAHLPRKKDGGINAYPLGLAAVAARQYPVGHLRECFILARDINIKLVSSSVEHRLLLGKFLMQLMA